VNLVHDNKSDPKDVRVRQMRYTIKKEAPSGPVTGFVDNYRTGIGVLTPFACLCGIGWALEMAKLDLIKGFVLFMAVVVIWGQMMFLVSRDAPSNFPGVGAMGLYLGTKCMFFAFFFFQLWPYVTGGEDGEGSLTGPVWNFAAAFFSFGVWYNWLKAHTSDPGLLELGIGKSDTNNLISRLAEANDLNRDTFCLTCACRKPYRSKHCSVTNRCVAKFDHYCPFVGNCIGADNHRYFMLFVMFMPCLVITYLILCKRYLAAVCPAPDAWYDVPMTYGYCQPFCMWTVMNGCLHTMWTSGLALAQLNQIAGDYTTNEAMNRWRYGYLSNGAPWSTGFCGNMIEFFRPGGPTIDWKNTFKLPSHESDSFSQVA